MTKATPQVVIAETAKPIVMKWISHGRRSYGEDWTEKTIVWNEETRGYDVEVEETEAPADGQAIFVPSNGEMEVEQIDYILGWQRKQAEARAANPTRVPYESMEAEVNAMWQEYVEQKLAWFQNRSQFGPGGHTQRGDR